MPTEPQPPNPPIEGAKRGRGRPRKPPGEKFLTRSFRIPPDVWALVEQFIPEGERSTAVTEGLRQAALHLRDNPAARAPQRAKAEPRRRGIKG